LCPWGAAALFWGCAWTFPALAIQLDYGIGTYLLAESNITRTETDGKPEVTAAVLGGVQLQENNSDVVARGLAQVEHRHFTRATFSDDNTLFIDGNSIWNMVPRRLSWMLSDTFREVQLSITSPNTPSNRTKSNSLITGPDATFAIDGANSLVFGARYGRFDIENSAADNRRYGGFVRAIHALSSENALSLNYEAGRIFFEPAATQFPEVVKENGYVRFESVNAGSGATIDVGRTHVVRYGGDPLDGNLVRATLLKGFGKDAGLRLSYADEISDTYSDLIRGVISLSSAPVDPPAIVVTGLSTTDLYHSKRGEVDFLNQEGRFQYTLQGWLRKVDFETINDDYDEKGARGGANWLMSAALRFNAYGEYSSRNYFIIDRQDTDRNYIVGVDYRLNSNLIVRIEGGLSQRDSSVPGASYADKRGLLFLGFGTGAFDVRSRR
jgi:hypothetical protein